MADDSRISARAAGCSAAPGCRPAQIQPRWI